MREVNQKEVNFVKLLQSSLKTDMYQIRKPMTTLILMNKEWKAAV